MEITAIYNNFYEYYQTVPAKIEVFNNVFRNKKSDISVLSKLETEETFGMSQELQNIDLAYRMYLANSGPFEKWQELESMLKAYCTNYKFSGVLMIMCYMSNLTFEIVKSGLTEMLLAHTSLVKNVEKIIMDYE
jgi:hypothetical protein